MKASVVTISAGDDRAALAALAAFDGLPIDPGLCIGLGLLGAFAGSLVEHALHKFSPSLLLIRVEKELDDPGEPAARARLTRLDAELQRALVNLPAAVLVEYSSLGLALIGSLALVEGGAFWPGDWAGIGLLLLLAVLLCGVLPDRLTDLRAERIVYRALPFLRVLRVLLLPLTAPLTALAGFLVGNVLGLRKEPEETVDREKLGEEIRAAVEDSAEKEQLADEEKEWIENIVAFRNEDVAGIMTPRTDLTAVEAATPLREAVRIAVDAGHSRLPVYDQKLDNVVGILYLRDAVGLLADGDPEEQEAPVQAHMRPAYFVPESKKVTDLLREFRSRRLHIAVVVDEYGGTAGLVTLEDVLEEIVGELADEHDARQESPLHILEVGRLAEVDAKVRVADLDTELGVALPDSADYETVGGFIFSHLGRIPKAGESFQHGNVEITVLAATSRKVVRVRVRVLEATTG